ncbi:hypothetical protein AVEN_211262-1 [Araneus ventricosus]|uniref:Uncharacterized protein n=1 Tax=Araneus ventricosus TaxID=182803 RepID=A0A4Y2NRI9_ARAVE|nr:hypothetical protein AVEN_211262-1 [Araneus ventricosus]
MENLDTEDTVHSHEDLESHNSTSSLAREDYMDVDEEAEDREEHEYREDVHDEREYVGGEENPEDTVHTHEDEESHNSTSSLDTEDTVHSHEDVEFHNSTSSLAREDYMDVDEEAEDREEHEYREDVHEEFDIDSDDGEVHPEEMNRRQRVIRRIVNQGGLKGVTRYYLRLRAQQLNVPTDDTYDDIIDRLTEDSIIIQLPYRILIIRSEQRRLADEREIQRQNIRRSEISPPLQLRATPEHQTAIREFIRRHGREGLEFKEIRSEFVILGETLLKREIRAQVEEGHLAQHSNLKLYIL